MAVVRMNTANAMSSCWSDHTGASGVKSETPWRRRDLRQVEEGQDRMACSKVSGASEHKGQDVSASGSSHEGCAGREEELFGPQFEAHVRWDNPGYWG